MGSVIEWILSGISMCWRNCSYHSQLNTFLFAMFNFCFQYEKVHPICWSCGDQGWRCIVLREHKCSPDRSISVNCLSISFRFFASVSDKVILFSCKFSTIS